MYKKWIFLLGFCLTLLHEGACDTIGEDDDSSENGCYPDEKKCPDGRCIYSLRDCDDDCGFNKKRCDNGQCIDIDEICILGHCEPWEIECESGQCVNESSSCKCEVLCQDGSCVNYGVKCPSSMKNMEYVIAGAALIITFGIIGFRHYRARKQRAAARQAAANNAQEGQPLNAVNPDFSGTRMQPVVDVNNTTSNQTNPYAPPVYGPTMAGANPYPPPMNSGAAPPYPPAPTGAPVYPPVSTGAPVYPPASTGGHLYPAGAPAYPPATVEGPVYPPASTVTTYQPPTNPPATSDGSHTPSAQPPDGYHYTPPADLPLPPSYDGAVSTKP